MPTALFRGLCLGTFLVGGLCFLWTGWFLRRRWRDQVGRCQSSAPGVVVSIAHRGHPVVSYRVGTAERVYRSPYGGRPSPLRVGERVTLWYDPLDPKTCCIREEGRVVRLLCGTYLAVGILCISAAGGICWFWF